jgi:hypothetical protein
MGAKFYGLRKHKDIYQKERQEFEKKYRDILDNPQKQTFLNEAWEKNKLEISENLLYITEKRKHLNYLTELGEIDYDFVNDIFKLHYKMVREEYGYSVSRLKILKLTLIPTRQYVSENYSLLVKLSRKKNQLPEAEKYTQAFLEKFEAHRIDKKGID